MEMIQAATIGLSVELLNIAEKLAATEKQTPANNAEQEKTPDLLEVIPNAQDNSPPRDEQNPLVNNVLDYLNERLTTEDGDE